MSDCNCAELLARAVVRKVTRRHALSARRRTSRGDEFGVELWLHDGALAHVDHIARQVGGAVRAHYDSGGSR